MFDPVHPGEILKEDVLADAGLTVARAAEILGVGRPALSAVLNGRSSLSPEIDMVMARALAKNRADRYQTASEFSAAFKVAIDISLGLVQRRASDSIPNAGKLMEAARGLMGGLNQLNLL